MHSSTRMPGELGGCEKEKMLPRMGSERRGCSWLDGGTLRTMARPKIEHLMIEHRTPIRNRDFADSTSRIQGGTSGRGGGRKRLGLRLRSRLRDGQGGG